MQKFRLGHRRWNPLQIRMQINISNRQRCRHQRWKCRQNMYLIDEYLTADFTKIFGIVFTLIQPNYFGWIHRKWEHSIFIHCLVCLSHKRRSVHFDCLIATDRGDWFVECGAVLPDARNSSRFLRFSHMMSQGCQVLNKHTIFGIMLRRNVTHPVTMADVEIWNFFQRHFPKCLCYGNVLRRNVTHPVTMADVEIFSKTFSKVSLLWQYVTPKCYAPCYAAGSRVYGGRWAWRFVV